MNDIDNPIQQYRYGNLEQGTCLTVDVWPDNGVDDCYQARVWVDCDTADLEWWPSFQECIAWFGTMDTEQTHDCVIAPKATGIAPQRCSDGTWSWILVTDGKKERETWFQDCDDSNHPEIIIFSEIQEIF